MYTGYWTLNKYYYYIYNDKTDDNQFYYRMDHSLIDPLTTNYFIKPRQTITATCMPISLTYNNDLPYINITDGQTFAPDIALDTDHIYYSALGNIDPVLNIVLYNNTMNCK